MREDKVADRVCALDGMGIVCKGIQKPWIFGSYEGVGLFVGPKLSTVLALPLPPVQSQGRTHLVLIVFVQVDTAPLGLPPMSWHALVDVCLMYDLWNELWPAVDQGRVRGRELSTVDRIVGAIFDQKR